MTGTGVVTSERRRGDCAGIGYLIAMLVLVGAGVCPADTLNPSFETTYAGLPYPRPLPLYWGRVDHPSFNSYCTNLWRSDGTLSAGLFNRIGKAVNAGNYQSFSQFVDLTGIRRIEFDVRLVALPAAEFANFEASFLVDGVPLWSQTAEGVHLSQHVDVSNLAGWHRLEIRNKALVGGTFSVAYWTQWDNLRLLEGPATIPAVVDLNPSMLDLGSEGQQGTRRLDRGTPDLGSEGQQWVTCRIELGEGYDVRTIEGTTVTLNDIPAVCTGEHGWATPEANEGNISDEDGDGILERMVKFERAAVQAIIQPPEATVTIKGRLTGGVPFEGAAVLRVLDKGAKKK